MAREEPQNRSRRDEEVSLRDLDRIREKVTLAVEPSSLILAGLGVVLVAVAAFGAGYFIGQTGDTTYPKTSHSTNKTVALASSTPTQPIQQEKLPVVSPKATTGSVLPVPDSAPVPAPEPVVNIEPREIDEGTSKASLRRPTEAIPEPIRTPEIRREETAVVLDRRAPAPFAPAASPEDLNLDETAWPGVLVTDAENCRSCVIEDGACDPCTVPKPEPVPTRKVADETETAKPADANKARKVRPQPLPTRRYEIQVRSYQERQNAQTFAASLKAKGYKARVVPFINDKGVHWYRVRVGSFGTSAEASAWAADFNAREKEEAIALEAQ